MCECIKTVLEKCSHMIELDEPGIKFPTIAMEQSGITFEGGLVYYFPVTVRYKKGQRNFSKELKFFWKYCPICGNKIEYSHMAKNG